MLVNKPEGTEDLYGEPMRAWLTLQETAKRVFELYAFEPIEAPIIEQLALFVHGVGATTDVVQKEMFRVFSAENFKRVLQAGSEEVVKASKRLALRPEGTAGIVRAMIEHSLVAPGAAPAKLWYAGPMFRGERPAKGRLREFHQIGAEVLGADDPAIDAELIAMALAYFDALGFQKGDIKLIINSIGDAACRPAYREKLLAFIEKHKGELCADCLARSQKNPLRAFDCKNPTCHEIMQDAPKVIDHLCDSCAEHFEKVTAYLDKSNIQYEISPGLVRGLDYYTKTVFEFHAVGADLGSQIAIGGGGRYDDLVELEGGKPTAAAGFALGAERVLLALAETSGEHFQAPELMCYVVSAGSEMRDEVFQICAELRAARIRCEADYQARSMKSQMKQAGKLNARYAILVGPDELAAHKLTVRDMQTHEQVQISRDHMIDDFRRIYQN